MLAIITAYFNPQNCEKRKENYWLFRKKLEANGYKLFTIELSYTGKYDIEDADKKIQTDSVIWSKENLLNILVDSLPVEYTEIAWIDCDIIFQQYNTLKLAESLLKIKYDVLQLFSKVVKLPEKGSNEKIATFGTSIVKKYLQDGDSFEGIGEYGFAWAAKRSVFPLYDKCIVGGGDSVFFNSLINKKDWTKKNIKFSKKHEEDILCYQEKITNQNLRINFLDTGIFHIYHGSEKSRNYSARNSILEFFNYSPNIDVKYNDEGLLVWNCPSQEMKEYVEDYFINRQENDYSIDFNSGKNCSIVLMSWERPNNTISICEKLSKYNNVNDIVVINNSQKYSINIRNDKVKVLNSSKDFGLMSRISTSMFTSTDTVIFVDDDIIPSQNAISKIIYYVNSKKDMCSLHGRIIGPEGQYEAMDYFGYCPLVLTRCVGISKQNMLEILKEQRIWHNENKYWPKAEEFPADDIFMSLAFTSINNKQPIAIYAEYEDIGNNNAMCERPNIKQIRQKTIKELQRFFNTSKNSGFNDIKQYDTKIESKYKVSTLCPSLGKACGVGNFAGNMQKYIDKYQTTNNQELVLIQHEHGLFKDKELFIEQLKKEKRKKILFAHSPEVEFLEDYVDGFVQMCPGMINSNKPTYTMRHPGFYKNGVVIEPKTVGTCGFINSSRDFEYILNHLIPFCQHYGWKIKLPLSLHENHVKHEKYVELELFLDNLVKNHDCIELDKRFKSQKELFEKINFQVGWCWTNAVSKKYGSGTASDLYCVVNTLVVANKEQHRATFDLPNSIVAPNSLEKFTNTLIETCKNDILDYQFVKYNQRHNNIQVMLSWENQILGFIEWINIL